MNAERVGIIVGLFFEEEKMSNNYKTYALRHYLLYLTAIAWSYMRPEAIQGDKRTRAQTDMQLV